ncbi:MAG TPA: DNA recombination protein RmuC [Reyranella sp.]|nr:DNA recombination protein RmuC [Reyranella sp.]
MDILVYVLLAVIAALGAGLVALLMRRGDARAQSALADTVQRVEQSLREQERTLAALVSERLERSEKATGQIVTDLRERLVRIDEAQKKIGELSTQVVSLQQILTNKQARGAFGEVQLNDLLSNALPPSAYELQSTLSTGARVDCLLKLPNPPGPIAIDAKFPLESYHLLRAVAAGDAAGLANAQRAFQHSMRRHINDVRAKYILPGETAESALLFLPSEAIYAELHANFGGIVDESYRARVWIVSPTTMMATLNTVRAVLKDVQMREQASEIQKLVSLMMGDTRRLQERVDNLKKHFAQTEKDLRDIDTSTVQIMRRSERIQAVELGEQPEALPKP